MIAPLIALITGLLPAGIETAQVPDWIQFYGDMRLRAEHTVAFNAAGEDRTRGRMRVRFGARFDISEELKAEVRFTTLNAGDANNVNIDAGGTGEGQAGANAGIDRMNVTWMPGEDWQLKAGKYSNPFATNPVWGEWIWDDDIQPSGVVARWDATDNVDMRLGYSIVKESASAPTADTSVTTFQLNLNHGNRNLSTSLSNWASEGGFTAQTESFTVWDTIVSAKFDEVVLAAEYINNIDDDSGEDIGFTFGAKYGSGGTKGANVFSGSYFDFDANAFLAEVAQDDTPLSGTGGPNGMTGFEVSWKHWVEDNVMLRFWVLQADNDTVDPTRFRIDLNLSL